MIHEIFKNFVFNHNIRNGELASQEKLNDSVDVLKKEVDDVYNRSQIIRGSYAFAWQSQTYYKEGEIVYYQGKHYMVIEGQESINEIPSESYKWKITVRADWTMELDPNGYININNSNEYIPQGDYNPCTKKYADYGGQLYDTNINPSDGSVTYTAIQSNGNPVINYGDAINYIGLNFENGINFLPLDHTSLTNLDTINNYMPTADSHPATKRYVDDQLQELASGGSIVVGYTLNSNALGNRLYDQYVTLERKFSGNYNGFAVKNGTEIDSINSTDWMRTTSNGLLPYNDNAGNVDENGNMTNEGSSLGNSQWRFKEIHGIRMYSNEYNTTNADIAEKYTSDNNYKPGTILAIGNDYETKIFEKGDILAGVVSTEPGYTLNSDIDGVYIALKGRVPCKITGTAKRGDYINADDNGFGIASKIKNELTLGICINGGFDTVEIKI